VIYNKRGDRFLVENLDVNTNGDWGRAKREIPGLHTFLNELEPHDPVLRNE
jgi:hypothetical protein